MLPQVQHFDGGRGFGRVLRWLERLVGYVCFHCSFEKTIYTLSCPTVFVSFYLFAFSLIVTWKHPRHVELELLDQSCMEFGV